MVPNELINDQVIVYTLYVTYATVVKCINADDVVEITYLYAY